MTKIKTLIFISLAIIISCSSEKKEQKDGIIKVNTAVSESTQVESSHIDNNSFKYFLDLFRLKKHEPISSNLAHKFLGYDDQQDYPSQFFADSLWQYEDCLGLFYTSTCGVGGICESLYISFFTPNGTLVDNLEIYSRFGDFENSQNLDFYQNDQSFSLYYYRIKASVETLDTISVDTLKKELYIINPNCSIVKK